VDATTPRVRATRFGRAARAFVWWLLSPFAYPTATLALRTRCRVLLGPFAGMSYPPSLVARHVFGPPLQAGTYEHELNDSVEALVADDPPVVVNVGTASGYYAVGLARRLVGSRVIGYELDPGLREASALLARANGVADRVELRGECTLPILVALEPELGGGAIAVLMDCEGCETSLLDPQAVPWLARASILVEVHPSLDPQIGFRLSERLAPTHEVEAIVGEARWASRFPEIWALPRLRDIDRELLVAEHRHGPGDWLWATPR
jgi:hypothetical protein